MYSRKKEAAYILERICTCINNRMHEGVCVRAANIINTLNRRLTYANNLTAHDFCHPITPTPTDAHSHRCPKRHYIHVANIWNAPQVMQVNGFNCCGRSHAPI